MRYNVNATFQQGETYTIADKMPYQYDFGQTLTIKGTNPTEEVVQVHFSLDETQGNTEIVVGTVKNGDIVVDLPNSLIFNEKFKSNYQIYAFAYVTNGESGQTIFNVRIDVQARPKPKSFGTPEDQVMFNKVIEQVNQYAKEAKENSTVSKSYAVGGTGTREGEETDNAKYYSEEAKKTSNEVIGQVEDAKKDIDKYVKEKENELKGETGNVYFAAFKVVKGRLKMFSDPTVDKVRFTRKGSRLFYRLNF